MLIIFKKMMKFMTDYSFKILKIGFVERKYFGILHWNLNASRRILGNLLRSQNFFVKFSITILAQNNVF